MTVLLARVALLALMLAQGQQLIAAAEQLLPPRFASDPPPTKSLFVDNALFANLSGDIGLVRTALRQRVQCWCQTSLGKPLGLSATTQSSRLGPRSIVCITYVHAPLLLLVHARVRVYVPAAPPSCP